MLNRTPGNKFQSVLELIGRWKRVDDDFEGCIVEVKRQAGQYYGELKVCPYAMRLFGWKQGDMKWKDIIYTGRNEFHMMDLYIAYEPECQQVSHTNYYPCVLKPRSSSMLLILGEQSQQQWNRVATTCN